MKIHAYATCWNEERILPYYLRWYTSFCERVTIYDNHSTDNSAKIIKSFPNTEMIPFDSNDRLDDNILADIKNNCWKESDSDYVIIGDNDEILYHPDILQYLEDNKQYSIIESPAFEMISGDYPQENDFIHNLVKYGVPRTRNRDVNKKCIFDPRRVKEMNYKRGCHRSNPQGDINILELEKSEIKFLHYKYLSMEHLVERYLLYKSKRNPDNPILHTFNKEILQEKFNKLWERRVKIL